MIHLLVVDDDEDDCFLMKQSSSEVTENVQISCITNCKQLLNYLEKEPCPDVVLMDINMPGISGPECLKKIRAVDKWKSLPIIAFSTAAHAGIINQCYQAGASLFIAKPNSYSSLKELIQMLITKIAEKNFNFR